MKTFKYKSFLWVSVFCLVCMGCKEYPDAYKIADGTPEVLYVRLPDAAAADLLLDGAFLGNTICIVGNNLRSVYELYFNDQKAILNTSLITDHTLIVTVPRGIPEVVTNKIYLITKKGDKVDYPFKSKVPAPVVSAISCEYAPDGGEAVLYGDFFIDDPNVPLKITMAGNIPVTEIKNIQKTEVRFVIPTGAQKGYINVQTMYGTGRSHFQFRDDRGMILDWDKLNANGGWRSGNLAEEDGISGKYVVFKGNLAEDPSDWGDENAFSFNLWGIANGRPEGDFFSAADLDKLLFKFEINILAPWSSKAMQIVFTSWSTQGTNGYYGDVSYPRALWMPWTSTGSYQTDGWITVTIPMTEFRYGPNGKGLEKPNSSGFYGGLSMFVWHGGVTGKACSTEMWIDNIRVVPME